jgi:serine/threonine protein phosphatase PrpC
MGSDGLWDELNVIDVSNIVLKNKNDKVDVVNDLFK